MMTRGLTIYSNRRGKSKVEQSRLYALSRKPLPEPEPPPFAMRVPLGGGRWISIQSNKAMTPEAWTQFNRHLDLQHDIWADAQVDRNPKGHDPEGGHGAKHESPVGGAAAPKGVGNVR
jgi:hypothetical protein